MGKRHAFGLCLGMLGLLTVPHQNTRQGREAFAVTSAELRRLHGEVERLREVAEQALEVLESLQGGCTDANDGTVEAITVWCPEVVEALRAALKETK